MKYISYKIILENYLEMVKDISPQIQGTITNVKQVKQKEIDDIVKL